MIDRTCSRSSRGRSPSRRSRLDLLAQTESIFALSNGHIGLRGNLDEGEPHGVPGTYLNGFFESASAAVRRGWLRLSRGGPVADRRDQRQAAPSAGRRRAIRRAATARCRNTTRDSTCAMGCCAATVEWTSPGGAGGADSLDAARVIRAARRGGDLLRGRGGRRTGPRRRAVDPRRQRAGARATDDPRAAAALRAPLVGEYHAHHDLEVSLGHRTRVERTARGSGASTTSSRVPTAR